jgi:hypothetical protein
MLTKKRGANGAGRGADGSRAAQENGTYNARANTSGEKAAHGNVTAQLIERPDTANGTV